jgi:hypothetical protein
MQHSRSRRSIFDRLTAGLVALAAACPALALEPLPDEEKEVKACERKLCTMVLGRATAGPDLRCEVAKTWDRDTLKKGESSSVSWGFGDARCSLDLTLSRADIIAALTAPKHTVQIPEQEVRCIVEQDGKQKPVVVRLAPKLKFKNGKADKIWINLADVDGPTAVSATVKMAAGLEDSLGIFHGSMIKSVNKFIYTKCGERYFADGTPKPDPKEEKKKLAKAGADGKDGQRSKPDSADKPSGQPAEKSANPIAADAK